MEVTENSIEAGVEVKREGNRTSHRMSETAWETLLEIEKCESNEFDTDFVFFSCESSDNIERGNLEKDDTLRVPQKVIRIRCGYFEHQKNAVVLLTIVV